MATSPTVKTIQPGIADKLNKVKAVSSIVRIEDAAKLETFKDKVFLSNILIQFPDNSLRMTDGITPLKDLQPIVKEVLTEFEKKTLSNSLDSDTDTYTHGANGVAVLDSNSKLYEEDFKMLEGIDINNLATTDPTAIVRYQIKKDYLGWLYENNDPDGTIKLDLLPDSVRVKLTIVNTIADRDNLADDSEEKKGLVVVLDASADDTVDQGAAAYVWVMLNNEGASIGPSTSTDPEYSWVKIHEYESLDLNFDDIRTNYASVNREGAVMYDHNIDLVMDFEEYMKLAEEDYPQYPIPPSMDYKYGQFAVKNMPRTTHILNIPLINWRSDTPDDKLVESECVISSDPEGTQVLFTGNYLW